MIFLLRSLTLVPIIFLLAVKMVLAQNLEVDLDAGEEVFAANCAACHANGNNLVSPLKTLQIEVLEANRMNSINAITTQVKNGNGGMPKFGDRLSEEDINNVANYVLNQAKTSAW